jgi:ATP-dependent helicase/nuclease subunit A
MARWTMTEYLADECAIDEAEFTRLACDPAASVVVEACAGSGKTWLLVARIVRLLMAGVAPGEILAISYTRKAAREIESRLRDRLRELAAQPHDWVRDFLAQIGVPQPVAAPTLERARELFEQVGQALPPITVSTFHGWFAGLL